MSPFTNFNHRYYWLIPLPLPLNQSRVVFPTVLLICGRQKSTDSLWPIRTENGESKCLVHQTISFHYVLLVGQELRVVNGKSIKTFNCHILPWHHRPSEVEETTGDSISRTRKHCETTPDELWTKSSVVPRNHKQQRIRNSQYFLTSDKFNINTSSSSSA